MVVVARVHPLEHARDRDGIEPRVAAAIELLAQVENALRGQRVLPGRVVLNDPAARRGARERIGGGVLEFGKPFHVGEPVAERLELVLEGEAARRRRQREVRDVVGRTFQQARAAERSSHGGGVYGRLAGESGIGRERDVRRGDAHV